MLNHNVSGIYRITCTSNGKIYIGSAVKFSQRKRQHLYDLRKNQHGSHHFQKAYNKYGEDQFVFELIECVLLEEDLLIREQWWLDFYKPYDHSIGFNICKIAGSTLGLTRSEETRKRISEVQKGRIKSEEAKINQSIALKGHVKKGKCVKGVENFRSSWYEFISPQGVYYCGVNIVEFCRQKGLHKSALSDVKHGRKLTYKGWFKPGNEPERNLHYKFVSPDGVLYEGENITEFARQQKLSFSLLCALHRGDIEMYKGWTKDKTPTYIQIQLPWMEQFA